MNPPEFSFHPAAIEEAENAARWYRERSPRAAKRFVKEVNQEIEKIREAPGR
jgi:plasmid stabilization system protein ParE